MVLFGLNWGDGKVILGLYWDSGKESGNDYLVYWGIYWYDHRLRRRLHPPNNTTTTHDYAPLP